MPQQQILWSLAARAARHPENSKRKVKVYTGKQRYLVNAAFPDLLLLGERCLKCMYAKKAQFDYARSDETGHSHFTRRVKKGAKRGTVVGCKHGAATDSGISPLLPPCANVLPETLSSSWRETSQRFPRTSLSKTESPAPDQNLANASKIQTRSLLQRKTRPHELLPHAQGGGHPALFQLRFPCVEAPKPSQCLLMFNMP